MRSHPSLLGPEGRKKGWRRGIWQLDGRKGHLLAGSGRSEAGLGNIQHCFMHFKAPFQKENASQAFFSEKPSVRKGSPGGSAWASAQQSPDKAPSSAAGLLPCSPSAPSCGPVTSHFTDLREGGLSDCPVSPWVASRRLRHSFLGTQPVGEQPQFAPLLPEWGEPAGVPRPDRPTGRRGSAGISM